MIKYAAFITLTMTMQVAALAQNNNRPVKFKDFVFEEAVIQKNLLYKTDPPAGTKEKYYRFDWYEPRGDSAPLRPLIIWLHGGGFKFGKKTSGGLPLWGKTFARRGYTCAAINYRISKKHPLKNFADLVEGCADAIEDLETAINYFKQNSKTYRIDTNRIIVGGNSAGGMIGLQAVYSSKAELAMLAHRGDSTSVVASQHNPQHIAAVINYWGALFDINWLKNGQTPIVSVHGRRDRVVSIDNKNGIYGSVAIHREADLLHIPNQIKIYESYAHELQKHFNPLFAGSSARKRWREAGQFTADFLYEELFKTK